jgi:hypothetical protein
VDRAVLAIAAYNLPLLLAGVGGPGYVFRSGGHRGRQMPAGTPALLVQPPLGDCLLLNGLYSLIIVRQWYWVGNLECFLRGWFFGGRKPKANPGRW